MKYLFHTLTLALFTLLGAGAAMAEIPAGYSVTPAPGSTLESISEFTIGAGWIETKYGVSTASVLINGKTYTANLTLVNYDALKFTLDTPVDQNGTYNILLPENAFLVGWENDPSPILEWEYTVANENGGTGDTGDGDIMNVVPEYYTFEPAAGTELPVLTSFSVEASRDFFLTASSRKSKIKINGEQVDAITRVSGNLDNTLTWILANPVTEPGQYTVYIPEGSFYGYAETDNEPFIVTLKVTGGEAPEHDWFDSEVTSDPASGSAVASLSKIAIQYPKLTSAYLGPEAYQMQITGSDGAALDVPYTLTPDEDDFNEAHVIWLEFTTPITAEGAYTISFPGKAFEIAKYPNNWYSAPFSLTFNVSEADSLTEIATAADEALYYDLSGRPIRRPTAPGIYLRHSAGKTSKITVK